LFFVLLKYSLSKALHYWELEGRIHVPGIKIESL
jgi:hypothetical protein